MIKDLPIGIQSFEEVINGNFLYIDKTQFIYNIIRLKGYYFLSRPRRFGKSLLISTLESLFSGKKELFKGLKIEQSSYDWQEYPVIRIDFSTLLNKKPEELQKGIIRKLVEIGKCYSIDIIQDIPLPEIFLNLLKSLHQNTNRQVVVLIDEYDKPLIDNITNPQIAQENRDILKSFYGILKPADPYLRFVLLTGVTKFSKVSVFSDLNNLNDISISTEYADLLGCTQEELDLYFTDHIKQLTDATGEDEKRIKNRILKWYNGYRFSIKELTVYNPFSLLLLFKHNQFRNYWFETATPTFLIKLIKEKNFEIKKLEDESVSELAFSGCDMNNPKLLTLLLQTGYVTITGYNTKRRFYTLNYPNYEVKESFLNNFVNQE
ncbi:MAG: AAA family ATPase [bacterium]|nr:AAA family ATPase [bacterium]